MFELKALKSFRDKTNPEKNFKVGETLSTDDLERVNNLVSRGICVIVSVGEKKQSGAAGRTDNRNGYPFGRQLHYLTGRTSECDLVLFS